MPLLWGHKGIASDLPVLTVFWLSAEKGIGLVWQLSERSQQWGDSLRAQAEGTWCSHDTRKEAVTRHMQYMASAQLFPAPCLRALAALFHQLAPVRHLLSWHISWQNSHASLWAFLLD